MNAERDESRIVRSWLEDGVTVLPDRVLDAVLDQLSATPQRRAGWLAQRFPIVNNNAFRFGIAGAAALLVAVIGINFLPGGGGTLGGSLATPSPTISATPTPTPLALPQNGSCCVPLAAGAYLADNPFPVRLTFTLPDGWQGNLGGGDAIFMERPPDADRGRLDFTFPASVFADACDASKGQLQPAPGPSVDDFVNAIVAIPGLRASAPTDVNFAGYRGQRTTLTPPKTSTCAATVDGEYPVWRLPLGAVNGIRPGKTQTVTVLDVAGHRLVISSVTPTAAIDAEVQSILDSVRIEPANR